MEEIDNNEALKKAKEVLHEISEDEKEKELAFQRLMYKMDQKAIEAAGYDKGKKAGIQQIAKRMLKNKISMEIIISCTGLTKEEIEELE